jgi:hypothetical protein
VAGWLWRFRQRFGIAAPHVAVHSAVPWYWRTLGLAVLVGAAVITALWIYDRATRLADDEVPALRRALADAERSLERARADVEQLRGVANAADSRVSIERTAQQKLAQQLRTLEQENARLREDLATFDNLLSSESRGGPALLVQRFQVEPDVLPGEYRYRLLLFIPKAPREREFQGRLELVVTLNDGGRSAIISFPEPADAGAAAFRLGFKHFQRVEGTFRVSPKAKVETVQVRVYEAGSAQPRATRSVKLG